ncbi:MAG: hypothetical protein WBL39_22690 [Terrimicrobiaceae bacterium]
MIRFIVPFPPGATSDGVGRIIAHRLCEVLAARLWFGVVVPAKAPPISSLCQ